MPQVPKEILAKEGYKQGKIIDQSNDRCGIIRVGLFLISFLRKLDASVTKSATVVALILGIVGALTLGFGMSLFMTELGEILVSNQIVALILGIIFGVIGIITASLAWPVYNLIVKIRRKKLAPEIIRLADELMK